MKQSKYNPLGDIVFQFLVALVEVDPLVWRRIRVLGKYSFWDLHVAIQDAMGWQDYHLHEFRLIDPKSNEQVVISIPNGEPFEEEIIPDYLTPISEYFVHNYEVALYIYDFGDDWRHTVALETWLQPEEGIQYPQCMSGARKCPPEDCGGPGGYEQFLKAIQDPSHEEHETFLAWIGGEFDPEEFDPKQVQFDDPEERWRIAFEES
jgi:hypothetical protein